MIAKTKRSRPLPTGLELGAILLSHNAMVYAIQSGKTPTKIADFLPPLREIPQLTWRPGRVLPWNVPRRLARQLQASAV
jgi:hypothetical protein